MTSEARSDVREAKAFFTSQSARAGAAFVLDVRKGIQLIRDYPQIGSPHVRGSRRLILNRFPYSIVYLITIEGARIVAFAHHSRDATYWHKRIGPPLPDPSE